ncbi:tetratricopeptide repeat protein [Pseudanabaena mucicola]|uniref:Tetratricopeptide repeat protein n=1 Tax=Pseudanabaena mucicola FACHB-723 TaxID=2692860 RepID=A0ABR8A0C8_9CYAN|nr:tetratricopeptide repeat protein [Pseudanabaena mucicola]MBD2189622.1 tetratricopeptide repeat protein [Pseudanabaena mucicola FACHB-723]
MDSTLAIAYLGALVLLLAGVSWLVIRQILKARSLENVISDLQPKLQKEKGTPEDYYQLGSVYLRKKLYSQAIALFNKALKEGGDNIPEVYNALGFSYFSQEQYDLAIKNYKEAIALQDGYVTAINNLAHAYEKKKLLPQSIEMYEQVLKLDEKNEIAKRRLTSLRKQVVPTA